MTDPGYRHGPDQDHEHDDPDDYCDHILIHSHPCGSRPSDRRPPATGAPWRCRGRWVLPSPDHNRLRSDPGNRAGCRGPALWGMPRPDSAATRAARHKVIRRGCIFCSRSNIEHSACGNFPDNTWSPWQPFNRKPSKSFRHPSLKGCPRRRQCSQRPSLWSNADAESAVPSWSAGMKAEPTLSWSIASAAGRTIRRTTDCTTRLNVFFRHALARFRQFIASFGLRPR